MKTLTMTLVAACCFALMGTQAWAAEPLVNLEMICEENGRVYVSTLNTVADLPLAGADWVTLWAGWTCWGYVSESWYYFGEAGQNIANLARMGPYSKGRWREIFYFENNRASGFRRLLDAQNLLYILVTQLDSRIRDHCYPTYLELSGLVKLTRRFMNQDVELIVQDYRERHPWW